MSTQFSIGGSGGLENSDSSRRRSAQSSSDISFESVLSDRIHSLDKADPIKINDAIPKEYAELSDRINEIMHSATEEQHKRMGAHSAHHIKINQPDTDGFVKHSTEV